MSENEVCGETNPVSQETGAKPEKEMEEGLGMVQVNDNFILYNMHGNVSEWCFDYYGGYDLENTANPAGAASGSLRVNRGRSCIDFAKHLRSAYRSATNPIDTDQTLVSALPEMRRQEKVL